MVHKDANTQTIDLAERTMAAGFLHARPGSDQFDNVRGGRFLEWRPQGKLPSEPPIGEKLEEFGAEDGLQIVAS